LPEFLRSAKIDRRFKFFNFGARASRSKTGVPRRNALSITPLFQLITNYCSILLKSPPAASGTLLFRRLRWLLLLSSATTFQVVAIVPKSRKFQPTNRLGLSGSFSTQTCFIPHFCSFVSFLPRYGQTPIACPHIKDDPRKGKNSIKITSNSSLSNLLPYAIVSPSSCPPSTPSGSLIGQSDPTFSEANGGLQYLQYPNSQFIIKDASDGSFFVDFSSSSYVSVSDTDGDTLILYNNGTFQAFVGSCQVEIVGSWLTMNSNSNRKRMDKRNILSEVFSEVCRGIHYFCDDPLGIGIAALAEGEFCSSIGSDVGASIGGAIGSLGEALGPEVGIPATIVGESVGGIVGDVLCTHALAELGALLCKSCRTCSSLPVSSSAAPSTLHSSYLHSEKPSMSQGPSTAVFSSVVYSDKPSISQGPSTAIFSSVVFSDKSSRSHGQGPGTAIFRSVVYRPSTSQGPSTAIFRSVEV
jgi:hypothetical protein